MTLGKILARHACARDLKPNTVIAYGEAVGSLERFAGRSVHPARLSARFINRWIDRLLSDGYARITIRNYSLAILTLWRASKPRAKPPRGIESVRRVKVPTPIPEAWTREEFKRLLASARRLKGKHRRSGIRWAVLARVWLLADYDSGLRRCDLLNVPLRQAISGKPFVILQSKTDWPITINLRRKTVEAIRASIVRPRELLLPLDRNALYGMVMRLLTIAGLPGCPKWLRRTGATAVECVSPGGAMAYLGHRTHGLAYKYYVDPKIVGRRKPMPPAP